MGRTYKKEPVPSGKKNQVKKQNKKNRDKGKDFSCFAYNNAEEDFLDEVTYDEGEGFEKFSKNKHGKR